MPFEIHEEVLNAIHTDLTGQAPPLDQQEAIAAVVRAASAPDAATTRYADTLSNLTAAISMGVGAVVLTGQRHWHGGPHKLGPRVTGLHSKTSQYRAGVFLRKHALTENLTEADWLRFAAEEMATDAKGVARSRAYLTNAFHAVRGYVASAPETEM